MTRIAGHCIVAGSGMAGLLAARVAADAFDQVTLIERDDVPMQPGTRRGLPQGHHFHALIPGGLAIACELFPGFTDDLVAAGALASVGGQDFYVYQPEGKSYAIDHFKPEPEPGLPFYVQTRGLLEHTVRKRVEALSNLQVRYGCRVLAPLLRDGRVAGVTCETAAGAEEMAADLVIDATGKACRTLQWLDQLGMARPEESVVNCDFAYTSMFMRPENWNAFEGTGFFVAADPEGHYPSRSGGLIKMEGGLWLASLAGRFGDFPPSEVAAFREWAQTLLSPVLSDLITDAQAVSPPAPFRFPRSIRRHFERLHDFPDGLVPIGDAICHYNPLYGQGMSAAARQAQALGRLLRARADAGRDHAGLAFDFFPLAYQETRAPWLFAALSDFQMPQTQGDYPAEEQESIDMMLFLRDLAAEDPAAGELLASMGELRAPLSELTSEPWRARRAAARQ